MGHSIESHAHTVQYFSQPSTMGASNKPSPLASGKPSPLKAVAAGGIAGAIEICCTYPIEFTKTMQQLSTSKVSIRHVITQTLKKNGPLGLYKGLDSMLIFAAPKAGVRFSSKESFSSMLTGFDLGKISGFVAGLGAGACEAAIVTTPQETLKIKLIDDQFKSKQPRYRNTIHGIRMIMAQEGLRATYQGAAPTIFKVATAQATRFGIFEVVPSEFRNRSPLHVAGSGAFAGGVSVLLFQWVDTVKSRMQGLDAARYRSSIDCLRQIVLNEGPKALYKGVGPRMIRAMLDVAITMSCYSEILKLIEKVW